MNAEIFVGLPDEVKYFSIHKLILTHPDEIINSVCEDLNVDPNEVLGQSRKREFVEARQIAIGIVSLANPRITLKELGKMFGGRDHSTIIYAKRTFEDLYLTNKIFRNKVDNVKLKTHLQ